MESNNINMKPCEIKISKGRQIGLRNSKPVELSNKPEALPTLAEVKAKMAGGEKLTPVETDVLLADIRKTEAEYAIRRKKSIEELQHRFSDAKYKFHDDKMPTKQQNGHYIISEFDPKRTAYRPKNNDIYTKKGGITRAMEKIGELAEKKAELTERNKKIITEIDKLSKYAEDLGLKDIKKIFKK